MRNNVYRDNRYTLWARSKRTLSDLLGRKQIGMPAMVGSVDLAKLAFALQVKRGRKTLQKVAEESGVNTTTLWRIQREHNLPSLEAFVRFCDWLDVDPRIFLRRRAN